MFYHAFRVYYALLHSDNTLQTMTKCTDILHLLSDISTSYYLYHFYARELA